MGVKLEASRAARARNLLSAGRRFGWGIADQGMSSVTNLIVGIVTARTIGLRSFGVFTLAYAAYLTVIGASRAVVTQPLSIRYSSASTEEWRSAAGAAAGTALVLGCGAGVVCVAAGALAGGTFGRLVMLVGLLLPGLLVQDAWRYAFFAADRGLDAFLNDLLWLILETPLLVLAVRSGTKSAGVFLLAWGAPATVAAAAGALQARMAPRPAGALSWWRRHRDIMSKFFVEFLVVISAQQVSYWGVGILAGYGAAGALRAGGLILSPIVVLATGATLTAIPEGARALQVSPKKLARLCVTLAVVLGTCGVAWGTVVMILPSRIGHLALGPSWSAARHLAFPLTITTATFGMVTAFLSGLRALAAAGRILRVSVLALPATIAPALVGARINGATGAAWGLALSSCMAAALWAHQLRRALREHAPQDPPGVLDAILTAAIDAPPSPPA